MTRKINLIGKIFGRLTVIERLNNDSGGSCRWLCKCECGNTKEIVGTVLRDGRSTSCGCLQKEVVSKMMSTHRLTKTPLYRVWSSMRERCISPTTKFYKDYGGRGISVCEEWKNDFLLFYNWANDNGYERGLTIDRKDNNGNYCPKNCRWTTMKIQGANKRNNKNIIYNGQLINITEAARLSGIAHSTLNSRRINNWAEEDMFLPVSPYIKQKKYE